MTPEQQNLFVRIMAHSIATGAAACGESHPLDALRLYVRSYPNDRDTAIAAMAAFWRRCSYCPEQAIGLEQITDAQFEEYAIGYWQRKDDRKTLTSPPFEKGGF